MKVNRKEFQFLEADITLTEDEILQIRNSLIETESNLDQNVIEYENIYRNTGNDSDFENYIHNETNLKKVKKLLEQFDQLLKQ